jgi:hypothetical protein
MASTAAVQSPADLANVALVRMGYKLRVGSLYDGSAAAKKILDVYAQTRDELLRAFDWGFAERSTVLTLQKSAPALPGGGFGYIPPTVWNGAVNPPLPWLFQYAYPADCLKIRLVKAVPLFVPNFDPQPNQPAIANDSYVAPAQRVILSNIPNATLVYTGQVTDPATWDVGFVAECAAALERSLGPALIGSQAMQAEAANEAQAAMVAQTTQG